MNRNTAPDGGEIIIDDDTATLLDRIASVETDDVNELVRIVGCDAATFQRFVSEMKLFDHPDVEAVLAAIKTEAEHSGFRETPSPRIIGQSHQREDENPTHNNSLKETRRRESHIRRPPTINRIINLMKRPLQRTSKTTTARPKPQEDNSRWKWIITLVAPTLAVIVGVILREGWLSRVEPLRGLSPSIAITNMPPVPPASERMASEPIRGTVTGGNNKLHKIVVYAFDGDSWQVQPHATSPDISFGDDGKWETQTHGGTEFAAFLVKSSYKPQAKLSTIPATGGDVLAVARGTRLAISITTVPVAGPGGERLPESDIAGVVKGIPKSDLHNYRVVVYSFSEGRPEGPWYIQPTRDEPFTDISQDCTWNTRIHSGSKYMAIVVENGYRPAPILATEPLVSDGILAKDAKDGALPKQ